MLCNLEERKRFVRRFPKSKEFFLPPFIISAVAQLTGKIIYFLGEKMDSKTTPVVLQVQLNSFASIIKITGLKAGVLRLYERIKVKTVILSNGTLLLQFLCRAKNTAFYVCCNDNY